MTKEEWWKKYNSWDLCYGHSKKFDEWWDPDKYNWGFSYALAEYCSEKFNTWWDSERFDWHSGSRNLTKYCHKYFNKWWDINKYDWHNGYETFYMSGCSSKFTDSQLKQLLLHSHKYARKFAVEELKRREDEKRNLVGNL